MTASRISRTSLLRRSLSAQATVLILCITLFTLGSSTFISTYIDKRAMQADMEETAKQVNFLLRLIIDKPMIIGADDDTRAEFASLAAKLPGVHISIAGFSGDITYSTDTKDVRRPLGNLFSGGGMPAPDRDLLRDDYNAALKGDTPPGSFLSLEGRRAFLHVSPIFNGPDCHHCHGASQPVLGAMAVLQDVDNATQSARNRMIRAVLFSCAGGLFLILGIVVFIRKRIVRRLAGLEATTNAILAGETNIEGTAGGSDELGRVANNLVSYLKQSFQKLGVAQSVMNGLTIPAVMCDAGGRLTWVNQSLLDLLHDRRTPQELSGSPADALLYGEAHVSESLFQLVLSRPGESQTCETPIRRRDGKTLHLHMDANPVTDLNGILIGVFVCAVDLTDIRDHQAAMIRKNAVITETVERAGELNRQMGEAVVLLAGQIETTRRQAAEQQMLSDGTVVELDQINVAMADVSRTTGQVAEHAEQTRGAAEEGARQALSVARSMEGMESSISTLKEQMRELGAKTEGISAIMQVIQDIADQTNLLALNAAIEAARAGTAGKGFSVVADEVRKLAEKTMQATVEVGRTVTEIRNSAEASMLAVEKNALAVADNSNEVRRTEELLQRILSLADSVAAQVQSAASATQQQAASIENVHGSIMSIKSISGDAAEATCETENAVQALMRIAERLDAIMHDMLSKDK